MLCWTGGQCWELGRERAVRSWKAADGRRQTADGRAAYIKNKSLRLLTTDYLGTMCCRVCLVMYLVRSFLIGLSPW